MDLLKSLTPQQKLAVQHKDGPIMVVAGPGSGKTRVITHRVAWLIADQNIPPETILAVTFTRKAAGEMRERLRKLVQIPSAPPTICTFHSLGAQILRAHAPQLGLTRNFTVFDDDDSKRVVKQVVEQSSLNGDTPRKLATKLKATISRYKNWQLSPDQAAQRFQDFPEDQYPPLYEIYENLLAQSNALDFDDLLLKTVQLFDANQPIRDAYRQQFKYLLVDEFQDTNQLQMDLILHLVNPDRNNLFVVGDPNQSIYSWRHADIKNILGFKKHFRTARAVNLSESFRSVPNILKAANALISNNSSRAQNQIWTKNEEPKSDSLKLLQNDDPEEEARSIMSEVRNLINSHNHSPNQIAIMYRTNAQSRAFETEFIKAGISYELVGSTAFYERREIKDILAYARLIANPSDQIALQRIINVPRRAIGKQTFNYLQRAARANQIGLLETIQKLNDPNDPLPDAHPQLYSASGLPKFASLINHLIEIKTQKSPSELLRSIYYDTGYKDMLAQDEDELERMDNVEELIRVASNFQVTDQQTALEDFLAEITLEAEVTQSNNAPDLANNDRVTLITLHRSKGLEYDTVFITGMEEGVLPHNRSLYDSNSIEEERRLCYVGMTRARKQLFLSVSFRQSGLISRFLREIPEELLNIPKTERPTTTHHIRQPLLTKQLASTPAPKPLAGRVSNKFNPSDKVQHKNFGQGTIVSLKEIAGDTEITIAFNRIGVKKFMLSHTPIQKLTPKKNPKPTPN